MNVSAFHRVTLAEGSMNVGRGRMVRYVSAFAISPISEGVPAAKGKNTSPSELRANVAFSPTFRTSDVQWFLSFLLSLKMMHPRRVHSTQTAKHVKYHTNETTGKRPYSPI